MLRWQKNITLFSLFIFLPSPFLLFLSSWITSSNLGPEARCLDRFILWHSRLWQSEVWYSRSFFETTVTIYQTTRCLAQNVSSTFLAFSIVFFFLLTFFLFSPPSYSFSLHFPLLIVFIEQSGNGSNLKAVRAQFESRLGHRLLWGISWFSSIPSSKFRYCTSN
jgi:hypothetical protein